jgi:ubiquinone/menaquinone biosynthesis C-methylase UbiE
MTASPDAAWSSGDSYEHYVGRWSRLVAREFVDWLGAPARGRWLDVGCGTGALTEAVLSAAQPFAVHGIDPSPGFVDTARARLIDPSVTFAVGDAMAIDSPDDAFDVAASALVLNFVPDPAVALAEMTRVVRPGGIVGFYVWDYVGGMEFMKYFWDAAVDVDPTAALVAEGARFENWTPDFIHSLLAAAGLEAVTTDAVVIPTYFADVDDFWTPFLGGQGPAPTYLLSLEPKEREQIRALVMSRLPIALDGGIPLTARAWSGRGVRPE